MSMRALLRSDAGVMDSAARRRATQRRHLQQFSCTAKLLPRPGPVAVHADASAMQFHQALGEGHADAQSHMGVAHAVAAAAEHVEDLRQHLIADTGTLIADGHGQPLLVLLGADADLGTQIAELGAVVENAGEHLNDAPAVHVQPHRAGRQFQPQMLLAALQHRAVAVDRPVQQGLEVDALAAQFQLPIGNLRDIGQIIDQAGELDDLALDHAAGGAGERVVVVRDPP